MTADTQNSLQKAERPMLNIALSKAEPAISPNYFSKKRNSQKRNSSLLKNEKVGETCSKMSELVKPVQSYNSS